MQAFEVDVAHDGQARDVPAPQPWSRRAAAAVLGSATLFLAVVGLRVHAGSAQPPLALASFDSFDGAQATDRGLSPVKCLMEGGKRICGCVTLDTGLWLMTLPSHLTLPGEQEDRCQALFTGCSEHIAAPLASPLPCTGLASLRAQAPQCTDDGKHKPLQCGASGCWCSTPNGWPVNGTLRSPSEAPLAELECQRLVKTCVPPSPLSCTEQAARARNDGYGAFVPQCNEDGTFAPRQCHGSTSECWCSLPDGTEIPGSRRLPNANEEECQQQILLAVHTTDCQAKREAVLKQEIVGAFMPKCEADGSYSPHQCHASTGHCWCVDQDGKMAPGTEGRPGPSNEECRAPRVMIGTRMTPCLAERADATANQMPGRFVPQCDATGDFSPRQCHHSTGHCWCVDGDGQEMPGTRQFGLHHAGEVACRVLRQQCAANTADACRAPVRSFGPCQLHGHQFAFNSSTGKCVRFDLAGCEGSRNSFRNLEQCEKRCPERHGSDSSSCLERRQVALDMKANGNLGVTVPECDEQGGWQVVQCRGESGCWCVDEFGEPFGATVNKGQNDELRQKCERLRHRCAPCERATQEKCTGEHQRRGMNCMIGECVESRAVTM